MSAARHKGKWVGGVPVLGYDVVPGGGRLIVNEKESRGVREKAMISYHALFDISFSTNVQESRRSRKMTTQQVIAEHTEVVPIIGQPDPKRICTSIVERQNLTIRMSMRRLTRLTNAFSKKWENLWAAYCLHFAYYNFCRIHKTLRVTPAMESGLTDHVWELAELLA
jgi:hypothetical protein